MSGPTAKLRPMPAACVLVLAALLGGTPARAAAPRTADELAARGTRYFRAADYAHALTDFEEAVAMVVRGEGDEALLPVLRFNLGRCLEELGRPREAIDAFERYLDTPDSETARARATERIAALEKKHFARLTVECKPANAVVRVKGRPEAPCGKAVTRLDPGPNSARVASPDGPSVLASYTLEAGIETRVTVVVPARLDFVELPEPPPIVSVDGVAVPGPHYSQEVEPGLRRLALAFPDGRRAELEVRAEPGRALTVHAADFGPDFRADAAAPSAAKGPWPWVAYGAAVAAAAGGAWFWADAFTQIDAAQDAAARYNATTDAGVREEQRVRANRASDAVATDRALAYGLVGGAVVFAAVGTYLIWPSAGAPAAASDGGGIAVGPTGAAWSTRF